MSKKIMLWAISDGEPWKNGRREHCLGGSRKDSDREQEREGGQTRCGQPKLGERKWFRKEAKSERSYGAWRQLTSKRRGEFWGNFPRALCFWEIQVTCTEIHFVLLVADLLCTRWCPDIHGSWLYKHCTSFIVLLGKSPLPASGQQGLLPLADLMRTPCSLQADSSDTRSTLPLLLPHLH